MTVFDFGVDLWIELIILNDLSDQDILNLSFTCRFFSQLLKNEKLIQFVEERKIHFGKYEWNNRATTTKRLNLAIAWSHDNRLLASGDNKGRIYILETKTGKSKKVIKPVLKNAIRNLAYHPRDANLLFASYVNNLSHANSVCLWDIEKSKLRSTFSVDSESEIQCIAVHPQGRFLASGDEHGSVIRVWNVETGKCEQELFIQNDKRLGLCFTPDGNQLSASVLDSVLCFWDLETFRIVRKLNLAPSFKQTGQPLSAHDNQTPSPFYFAFFNDDNKTLAVNFPSDLSVKFIDIPSGNERPELSLDKKGSFTGIAIHPNQKLIALHSDNGFAIWDIEKKTVMTKHLAAVTGLSFSPNGRALVVSSLKAIEVFHIKKIFELNLF